MNSFADFEQSDCTAWDDYALQYLAKGLSVIPLAPKQKGPKLSGWSVFCEKQMTPDFAQTFYGHQNNIGLCLGSASGLMAVDIDTDDKTLLSKIEKIIPNSPVKKRGKKGYTAFYKYDGQISQSFKKGEAGIDILSAGRQTVLPPSVHPLGMNYEWITKATLLNFKVENLPSIGENQIEQLRLLFKPDVKKIPTTPTLSRRDSEKSEVEDALAFINPDESYEMWVEVGLAIRSEYGENGFDLFNRWSARGAKYDGVGACFKKYSSFESVRDITIATVFHYAMERGFERKNDWSETVEQFLEDDCAKQESWDVVNSFLGIKDIKAEEEQAALLSPPGLLGEVYSWVCKSSPVIQPMFCIASAIAIVSSVYAQKFKTDTGARSNNYVVAIGASGSGKSRVCDLVPWFMMQLGESYTSMLIGEPKSDAGLIDALIQRNGRGLLCIDEIGHYLRQMKAKTANAYMANVGAELTKLFSRANGVYISGSYSQNSKRASVTIDQPCLTVFGQSVKDRMFKALTEDDFIDGFFNRWLIFESEDKMPAHNTDYVDAETNYPTNLLNTIKELDKRVLDTQLSSNYLKTATGPYVMIAPKTNGAKELLAAHQASINQRRLDIGDGLMDYPLSRANEYLEKLSLTATELIDGFPVITERSMAWAIAAVESNLRQIESKLLTLTVSDYEESVQYVLRSLPLGKKLSQADFNNLTHALPPRQRADIMRDLLVRKYLGWDDSDGKRFLVRRK